MLNTITALYGPCPTPLVAAIMQLYVLYSSRPVNVYVLMCASTYILDKLNCCWLRTSWYDIMELSGLLTLGGGTVHTTVADVASTSVTWGLEGARGTVRIEDKKDVVNYHDEHPTICLQILINWTLLKCVNLTSGNIFVSGSSEILISIIFIASCASCMHVANTHWNT